MSNSLDSFLTRIGDVTIERVTPRGSPRSSDQGGACDDPPMRASVSNPCIQRSNDGVDGELDDTGGETSDGEHIRKHSSMEIEDVEEIHSEGSGDDMDLDDTIDTKIGVRMDSERHDSESPCPDDDVDAVNILDTLPLEGAPIEGQEVTEADLLGKPLMKDDDSESLDNDNIQSETQSGDEDDGNKRRGDSDDSDPVKKKQKKDESDDPECELKAEKKIANMRRNIREVMDETQLDEATLAAQRQEMERLRRVQEQQRIIREVQRQIAINRQNSKTQTRVISLLQGKQNDIDTSITESSSSSSSQVKLPSTVMLKVNTGTGTTPGAQIPSGVQLDQPPRRPIEGMRWQKGRGGYQGTQTSISRVPNARAQTPVPGQTNMFQQRIRMMTPSVSISPVVPKNEPLDRSEYYSDSDVSDTEADDVIYEKQMHTMRKTTGLPKSQKPAKGKDVVTISSSSESSDDDCIVLSDPSGEEETDNDDDPANSGMHTNDRYNVPDEHGRVLVNVGHPDTEPDVYLAPQVARVIKPHQIGGIRFLYDNIVESIDRYKTSSGFGCILAHSMGLGKTLQVASFCDIFFRCTTAKTVLCIMPINTLQNWLAEFNMWLPYEDPNAVKFDIGLNHQKSESGLIETKHEIKEENSNHTDISSLSSRPISTESAHRSMHDSISHMSNMLAENNPYNHSSYENHNAMSNYYPDNMINKPGGVDQHSHVRHDYHNSIPQNSMYNSNMGTMNNYKHMKQEIDGNDMNTKLSGPIASYGADIQSSVGIHNPMDNRSQGQVYSIPDNHNSVMYPMMNSQGQIGGYPSYQNMMSNNMHGNNTHQLPVHREQEVKKENLHDSNMEVNIKKEPNDSLTKEEGTSTAKEESTDEKKPVEKVATPYTVDAPIGMSTRHRHFRLHILNDSHKTMAARARVITEWQKCGGVLLIGYELYRQLSLKKPNKAKRKRGQPFKDTVDVEEDDKNKGLLDDMHGALVNPGPDLVICDEGHRIKNSHASISMALKQMRTKRRIVLTGYPLQNNLLEYWCMVDFVRPNYLGTKSEFCNMFERPIQNGQCIDSTPQDIRLMRYRAHVLHALLEGFVQRRSHSVLQVSLPRKEEYILLVRMTPHQRKLYDTFMNQVVKTRAVPNPLKAFAVCCKIWNHPDILFHFLRKRQANEEDDLDLEETMGEKSTAGGKRTKPRQTKGESKKGKKVNAIIKNKPAASVPPNSSSSTSNENIEGENLHNDTKGNYSNYPPPPPPPPPPPAPMQNSNYTNAGQQNNYSQGYQNYRPNDQTNYYRNDQQTGEYNNYYNNNQEQQQRYSNQQSSSFSSYPQNDLNYNSSQGYNQNQNQQQQNNYSSNNDQTTNNSQKYSSHSTNSDFRADQTNTGNYDMSGMYSRQPYNFQDQTRNYPANDNQNVNQSQYSQNNNQQTNYQNQMSNQSANVSMTDYSSYGQSNQSQNYSVSTGTNNPQQQLYTRNDNSSLGYSSTQQNQAVQSQSHQPPSSTSYMGNQPNHQIQQNAGSLISNNSTQNYPSNRQNQPTMPIQNTSQTNNSSQIQTNMPAQNQSIYSSNQPPQNSMVQSQSHGYMTNPQSTQSTLPQSQMRGYQTPQQNQYSTAQNQATFSSAQSSGSLQPSPQGHGYSTDQNSTSKHGSYPSSHIGSTGTSQNSQNSTYPLSQPCQTPATVNQSQSYSTNQQVPITSTPNQQHGYTQGSSQSQSSIPPNQSVNYGAVQHNAGPPHGQPEQSNISGNYPLNQSQQQHNSTISNYSTSNSTHQNQYNKGQDDHYSWQGNYSQPSRSDQCNDQYFRDPNSNRYQQNNYFPQQNYVHQQNSSYDYNAGHATSEMNTKGNDNKTPQTGMIGCSQASGSYDKSTKDVGTSISGVQSQAQMQSNIVSGTNYGGNDNNISKPIQKMASCHGMNNRQNPSEIVKEDEREKEEVQLEKEKEEKSDDETLTKDEEKDLKNYSGGKEDPGIPYDWATDLMKGYLPGLIDASAKMSLFFCILEEAIRLGDRVLAFSQSLFTLNLIEDFLGRNNIKYPEGQTDAWIKNVNYYRLDGSTSALEREKLINEFNHNPKIHLFLVSTRAGSLGINLVGANRAIVFDASWNPCHDTQAVCRVYRYGQQKPCYVYRLVTDNCLERKIYDRQISKQGMADRVVDQCNPDAHLSLKEATTLSWDWEEDSQVQDFSDAKDNYSDEIMHIVLDRYSSLLTKQPFHHESLLVDRKDKKLSQAEKRLARRGYELEKMAANCSKPSYNYIPGNTATRAGGLQIRAIRGGDSGVTPKPVASVRPMQQRGAQESGIGGTRGIVGSRWIPAEVWQRQGMSAQEMTLPLDVVIPTNSPDKSSIVLKAGQRVMVLKSPKGIYMQLESGKIIAIRTALKINQQKREEEPKKVASSIAQRNVKPDVSFPLRNNSAISIIPKTPGNPSTPTPRLISRPGSSAGFKQQLDKDATKRPRNIPTPIAKPNTSQVNITNQVSLQRISKSKNDSMDQSSVGENSNSCDSQPRTDQRVEEVRLEDVVAEASSNPDYSPSNPNRTTNSDIDPALQRVCETKTQNYGTNPIASGQTMPSIQSSSHIESEVDSSVLKDDKNHVKQSELIESGRSVQTINNYGHKYSNQAGNNNHRVNDEIAVEEPIIVPSSLPPPPGALPSQIKQQTHLPQDMHGSQQLLTQQSPYSQRPLEMPKPMPDTSSNRSIGSASANANRAPVKERSFDEQEIIAATTAATAAATAGCPHGLSQPYPYTQYPRYYDYGDPRSQSLPAPYGSYFPSVSSHSSNSRLGDVVTKPPPPDRTTKLPEERISVPMPATYTQSTGAITSTPSLEPSEIKPAVDSTPAVALPTTASSRIDPHLSTAFSHPASTRYTGTYPPTPYDAYSQHYPTAPSSSAGYPPSGASGYGAYGGPAYNADYARMYSALHGPPPPPADPYMHRGYPPPTTHPSNYYSPFSHPPPPPYPNYSFLPPYPNPNMPNEPQPPAQ